MTNNVLIRAELSNPVDRKLINEYLISLGYKVIESVSEDSLRADLYIMDVPSARRIGGKILEIKKSTDVFIPVIIVLGESDKISDWLNAGFDSAMRMPFTKTELKANLDILLRVRSQSIELKKKGEEKYSALQQNIPGMIYSAKSDWSTEIVSGSKDLCGFSEKELNS